MNWTIPHPLPTLETTEEITSKGEISLRRQPWEDSTGVAGRPAYRKTGPARDG